MSDLDGLCESLGQAAVMSESHPEGKASATEKEKLKELLNCAYSPLISYYGFAFARDETLALNRSMAPFYISRFIISESFH